MQPIMDLDWNPKTLRFRDEDLESAFWQSEVVYSLRSVKMLSYFAGGIGIVESLFRAIFVEHGFGAFRLTTVIIFSSVIAIGHFVGSRFTVNFRHSVGFVSFTLFLGGVCYIPYIAPPTLVSGMFFHIFVLQIFNLLMPYSQVVKHWINVMTAIALCFQQAYAPVLDIKVFEVLIMAIVLGGGASSIMAYLDERNRRISFLLKKNLAEEKARSETLLANTLPESIANELKGKNKNEKIAAVCADTAVLFADIVGFTELSARMDPGSLVSILDDLFSRFDAVIDQHGLEKIKTIGDAYMAAAGVPDPVSDPLERVAEAALDILAAVERYRNMTGLDLKVRVGFHAGPVVAGVIGRKRFLFDLWGHTVNVASRLESTSQPGAIHITRDVAEKLKKAGYELKSVGPVDLKGIGLVETCYLLPRVVANCTQEQAA